MSRRLNLNKIAERRFLRLSEITYVDDGNVERKWELVQRTTRSVTAPTSASPAEAFELDAVDMLVKVKQKLSEPSDNATHSEHILIISQYRPPVDAVVLEFPAGLLDPGEDCVTAALRELREETGYVAVPAQCRVSPVLCYEPGLTDSCFRLVVVAVDGDLPENQKPVQHLEEGEHIQVHLVPKMGFLEHLEQLCEKLGPRCIVDGKVYTFAAALSIAC